MSDALIMWVVYDHPSDFPDEYVARKHVVLSGGAYGPTPEIMLSRSLDELRDGLEALGLVHLDRMEGDDPVILETWL